MARIDRLRHLITVLEAVKEEERGFSLHGWVQSCGTVACACGWATQDKMFMSEGFGLRNGTPAFGDGDNWLAVMEFFGLQSDEAGPLFLPEYYDDAHDVCAVVRRVRETITNHGGDPDAPDLMGPAVLPQRIGVTT